MTHNHPPSAPPEKGQMTHAEVLSHLDEVKELCKTELPVAKICAHVARDGGDLGRAGRQQVRPLRPCRHGGRTYCPHVTGYISYALRCTRE